MNQPGKWPLAGLFIARALPGLLLVWWFGIYTVEPPQHLGKLLYLLTPVLSAAVTGWVWRGRVALRPDWATRRPYSRLMAYLLFATVAILLPFVMPAIILLAEGLPLTASTVIAMAAETTPKALTALVLTTLINFALCLIQTDIGLSLGVWLRDWAMRRTADRA